MDIIKIAMIGIGAVLLAIQFKQSKPEYSTLIIIAASILICCFGINKLGEILDAISIVQSKLKISGSYIGILVRIIGISFICEFSSDICKDSGYGTMANQIQIFGKLSILIVSTPIFLELFDSVGRLL